MLALLVAVGGQHTVQAPHTMQWAVRQRETSTAVPSNRTAMPTVAAATTGEMMLPPYPSPRWMVSRLVFC